MTELISKIISVATMTPAKPYTQQEMLHVPALSAYFIKEMNLKDACRRVDIGFIPGIAIYRMLYLCQDDC